MAKFSGKIGYGTPTKTGPGIWTNVIVERPYYGDVIRNISKSQSSGGVNDDVTLSNSISIIADAFANENFQHMKYVLYMGAKWKINNVEVQHPRIILTIGGVYHD